MKFSFTSENILRVFFLLLFVVSPLRSLLAQDRDSIQLAEATKLIATMDSTHRADSLLRITLLHEIGKLSGSGNARQRAALVERLKISDRNDSIKKAVQALKLERLKSTSKGSPVAPFSDTLFSIYTRVGSFSARDRADAIQNKITLLYDDYEFKPDSLMVNLSEGTPEIIYHDVLVMSVNELEALWFNQTPADLAFVYTERIKEAIRSEREANKFSNIVIRIGAIFLIITGIFLIVIVINKLFKRISIRIARLKDTTLKGLSFRGYQFLDSKRELQVILFLSNVLRLFIIIVLIYISLPLLFSVFPWTQGIAETLIRWILSPIKQLGSALIAYLPNLFAIVIIATITHYIVKFLKFVASEIERGELNVPGFYPDWARTTFNIIRFLLYAFSFIIIFPYLPGSESPIFRGVSVFVGIIFSLGSSSAISNAVAGLVITYMRPFKIGDRIKIGELTGDVVEKSLLVTRIRTIKNEEITIPNSSILSGPTINYTTSAKDLGLILHTTVTIGYDVPWKTVHELLISAAIATDGTQHDDERKPFVLQTSLDDFYVAYQINVYTEQSQRMAAIYSSLHQNIQNKFNEANVEIMSPHYRAGRDGNMTTIPVENLPNSYSAPAFKVTLDSAGMNKIKE